MNVQQHVVNVVQVLFSKGLEDEQAARVIKDHVLVAIEGKVADSAQQLDLVHLIYIFLVICGFFMTAIIALFHEIICD